MSIKDRFHKAACRVYAWTEKHWFAKLMYPGAPAVRVLDAMVGSKCKYCMASRALMVGFGLGFGGLFGFLLVWSAFMLTLAESNFCKGE